VFSKELPKTKDMSRKAQKVRNSTVGGAPINHTGLAIEEQGVTGTVFGIRKGTRASVQSARDAGVLR